MCLVYALAKTSAVGFSPLPSHDIRFEKCPCNGQFASVLSALVGNRPLSSDCLLGAHADSETYAHHPCRELDHEKSRLRSELENVATRLNHVVGLKAQIKTELVKLIDDYLALKQDLRSMYSQAELTRSEALSLETQGRQAEQQVQFLHASLKALDLPAPSSIRVSKPQGGKT
ncbi:hypothetical protein DUNSADRAFT_13101 [Dunaliella salina]|uniref:Uncharacterized protein n=1 Tax=Dunaliella salina TaxID=3046 RepID=A0ABQ7GA44_DUNSA|nr:hypothetical protein DUNSADRAFT_13101 [Dunaliella salina]|eukprot:KAF5831461.1 hypothetical protein DUNSADRAFT_13101 [Dunaliella salina]